MTGGSDCLQRTSHARNTVHASQQPSINRALPQWDRTREDDNSAGEYPRSAHARNSPSSDKNSRGGGNASDKGADLEDDDASQEHPFDGVHSVELAVHQLQSAHGEEVRTPVPGNVVERVELVGDAGDGGGEDGAVLNRNRRGLAKVWVSVGWLSAVLGGRDRD